jgi:hypothetical protein
MKRNFLDAAVALGACAVAGLPVASAHDAAASLLACAAEMDDTRRLACFDAEVAQLRKQSRVGGATPVAPVAATPTGPTPGAGPSAAASVAAAAPAPASPATAPPKAESLSPEEKFGLRGELKREKLGDLAELSATATAIAAKPRGELVVTLDNGQVWAEIAPGSTIRLKVGDRVTIKAGSLGSFLLVAPNNRSSKVTRLR